MGAEVVYDAIDQIMQAAAIVLESDNAMRTCNAAYLTAGGISTLLAIIEHHAGLQGDNQLKSFASLGIPDARSSSSRLPAPSMQILVETLKVPHQLGGAVVTLMAQPKTCDAAVWLLQLLALCCRACRCQAGSSSRSSSNSSEANAALMATSISLAKQMLQSGLLQALPGMFHEIQSRLHVVSGDKGTGGDGNSSGSIDGAVSSNGSSSRGSHDGAGSSGSSSRGSHDGAGSSGSSSRGSHDGAGSSGSSSRGSNDGAGSSRAAIVMEGTTPSPAAAAAVNYARSGPLTACAALLEFLGVLLLAWPGNPWTSTALVETMEPACCLVLSVMRHSTGSIAPGQQQNKHGQQQEQQQEQEQQPEQPGMSLGVAALGAERQPAEMALKFCACLAQVAYVKPLQAPLVAPLQHFAASHGLMQVVAVLLATYGLALEGLISTAGVCSCHWTATSSSSSSGSSGSRSCTGPNGGISSGGGIASSTVLPAPPSVLCPCLSKQLHELCGFTPKSVASVSQLLDWRLPNMDALSPYAACTAAVALCDLQRMLSNTVLQSMPYQALQRGASLHMLVMLQMQCVMAAAAALQLQPRAISGFVCTGGSSSGSSNARGAPSSTSTVSITTTGAISVCDSSSSSSTGAAGAETVVVPRVPECVDSVNLWPYFYDSFKVWGDAAVLVKQLMLQVSRVQPSHVQQQQQQQQQQQRRQQQQAPLVPVAGDNCFIPTHHCSVSFSEQALELLLQTSKWLLTEVLLKIRRLVPENADVLRAPGLEPPTLCVTGCSRGTKEEVKGVARAVIWACYNVVFCATNSAAPSLSRAERLAALDQWACGHTAELAGLLQAVARQLPGLAAAQKKAAAAAAAAAADASSGGGRGGTAMPDCCDVLTESVRQLLLITYAEDQPCNSTHWPRRWPAGDISQKPGPFMAVALAAAAATATTAAACGGSSSSSMDDMVGRQSVEEDQRESPSAACSALANLQEISGLLFSLSKLIGSRSSSGSKDNNASRGNSTASSLSSGSINNSSQAGRPFQVHRKASDIFNTYSVAYIATFILCGYGSTESSSAACTASVFGSTKSSSAASTASVYERAAGMFGPSDPAAPAVHVLSSVEQERSTAAAAAAAGAAEGACASVASIQLCSGAAVGAAQLVPWVVLIGRCFLQIAGELREWLEVPPSRWWPSDGQDLLKRGTTAAGALGAALHCWRELTTGVEQLVSDLRDLLGPPSRHPVNQQQPRQQAASQQQPQPCEQHRQRGAAAAACEAESDRLGDTIPQQPWWLEAAEQQRLHAAGQLLASQLGSVGLESQLQVCRQALDQLRGAHVDAQSSLLLLPSALVDGSPTFDDLEAAEKNLLRKFGVPEGVRQRVLAAAQAALADGQPYVLHQMMIGAWQGCPEVSALVIALEGLGVALTGLPTTQACNNPRCTNMASPSELILVGGSGCMCGGCRVARYCGRSCQLAHWQEHKPVCRAIAVAAAAAATGSRATTVVTAKS